MTKKALVLVADGTEDMEAVITIDVLRRAQIQVDVANVHSKTQAHVECANKTKILPDLSPQDLVKLKSNIDAYDIIILPGGMAGAVTFAKDPVVQSLLMEFQNAGKYVAAICAGPIALLPGQIHQGKLITSHPSVRQQLVGAYQYVEERVVADAKLITSRGPGTAFDFALSIVSKLLGRDKAVEVSQPMLLPEGTQIL